MSNMVTRCPQCQTSFKVTEEHLKIANGAVRCGSCLHVFQARQHWVNPVQIPPTQAPIAKSAPVAPPVTAPAIPAQPAGNPEVSGKFQFDQSAIDNSLADTELFDSQNSSTKSDHATTGTPRKLTDIGSDDRISDNMDLEEEDGQPLSGNSGSTSTFGDPDDDYSALFDEVGDNGDGDNSEDFSSLLNGDFNDLDEEVSASNVLDESSVGTSDESWARDMLAEIESEAAPKPVDLNQVESLRDILTDFVNPVDIDAARRDLGIDNDLAARDKSEPTNRADMIAHIDPPPVELAPGISTYHPSHNWQTLLRWQAAIICLLLLLAVQYIGFHFTELSRQDSSRPYMQSLCNYLGCKLPAVENWRYIKISNLVVRKHPQVSDGLAIDAILVNATRQERPFPALELFFSDITKLPLASRRFQPNEYLSGELSGQTMMPAGRPVHIALEIVSPGADAVNWNLRVAGKTE